MRIILYPLFEIHLLLLRHPCLPLQKIEIIILPSQEKPSNIGRLAYPALGDLAHIICADLSYDYLHDD
jgi:hypothetical protein